MNDTEKVSTKNKKRKIEYKKTSKVWHNYITEEKFNVCIKCERKFQKSTSTTTLKAHSLTCKGSRVENTRFDSELSERYMTQCLLVHNISPTFLECPLVRRWIDTIRKDYQLPGRSTFTTKLAPLEVASLKSTIQSQLRDISSFCVSFDGWSSIAVRGYLGLMVHGIDDSWRIRSYLLALQRISKGETAVCVANMTKKVFMIYGTLINCIHKILSSWNIAPDSVVGYVTDGASNMKCAVERELKGKWFYCVPHMINRGVQVALKTTKLRENLLKPAKKIVRYLRKSNNAADEVRNFSSLHEHNDLHLQSLKHSTSRWE